jgi:hypothetical protein
MSDDLVERLKDASLEAILFEHHDLWLEAAAEIASLTAALAAAQDEADDHLTLFNAAKRMLVKAEAERDAEREVRKRLAEGLATQIAWHEQEVRFYRNAQYESDAEESLNKYVALTHGEAARRLSAIGGSA